MASFIIPTHQARRGWNKLPVNMCVVLQLSQIATLKVEVESELDAEKKSHEASIEDFKKKNEILQMDVNLKEKTWSEEK